MLIFILILEVKAIMYYMKKRILAISLLLVLCTSVLVGCGKSEDAKKEGTFSVVCTIFPQYDWIKEIVGENAENFELTLLLDKGVDIHSYQPIAADIAKIARCDMFIYVGGESDAWVDDALAEATNKEMVVINLLEVLRDSVKEEEIVEGMEGEGVEEGDEEVEGEEEIEYDEHVWLSLKNASIICEEISDSIYSIDSKNADTYKLNYERYIGELKTLDDKYQETVEAASVNAVLFGDRFPFRYMFDDYGLDYYAAFVGCSAETEANFETIAFLAGKVDELNLSTVFVIDSSDQSIAKTIIDNTKDKNQQILVMNSLQSVTSNDVENGITYLSVMQDNLEKLKQALN